MSIKTEITSFSLRPPMRWLTWHAAMAVMLVAFADWLLFREVFPGLSLAIFLAACGLVAIFANPVRASHLARLGASGAFALGILAIVEDLSWLSFFVALGATMAFAVGMGSEGDSWPRHFRRALAIPFVGGFWFVGDLLRVRKLTLRGRKAAFRIASVVAWIVPAGLFLVFVSLFASANPLIDEWVRLFDPRQLLEQISIGRTIFWICIACFVWPFVHMRRARRSAKIARAQRPSVNSDLDVVFGNAAVLRSLVLFNALFAVQTALDVAYLWGGLTLPDGLTYAAYAHRGAYPLIATALLAAAFVLIAMRPGGPAERSRWIRPLVLVWVAQNVVLVLSSLFRTSLYIAAYSLSELRLAAMIWMSLVAIGLILIVIQIAQRRSNKWLLDANAIALIAALYACCFINFPYAVANYNVMHCREAGGKGPALDRSYLFSLGPQAFPAYDAYFRDDAGMRVSSIAGQWLQARSFAQKSAIEMTWRSWSFRLWRLKQYFDTHPASAMSQGDSAPAINR
jgi:hypothetical protein